MDFLPTFAHLAGSEAPTDRIIDGKDISSMLCGEREATSDYEAFFYYRMDHLEAVRSDNWKLHLKTGELYDLAADIAEENNVASDHQEMVGRLKALAEKCREDIGDAVMGVEGNNRRPVGRIDNPDTLTHFDPDNPYMVAMYDWQT